MGNIVRACRSGEFVIADLLLVGFLRTPGDAALSDPVPPDGMPAEMVVVLGV